MTTAASTVPAPALAERPRRVVGPAWLLAGAAATAAGVVVAVVMSYVKHAPFPPKISISAYGLPPHGWLLTVAATLIGLGSVPLAVRLWHGPTRATRVVSVLLAVWTLGMVVLGWVHTNLPHTPATTSTLVHQTAAVVGMLAFPAAVAVLTVGRIRRGLGGRLDATVLLALTGASTACLVLLFFAAFGADTAGLGPTLSWALYQFTAAVIDVVTVFVVTYAVWRDDRALSPA